MRERTDVAIVGGGPAGIAAACAAAPTRRVIVLDTAPRPGGQIWRHREPATLGRTATRWLARLERSGARFTGGVSVSEVGPGRIAAATRHGDLIVEAESIVLATGARERYLPFPGWTEPGVMGVGGIQALIKSGMTVAGQRIVLAGSGPLLLPVAATCADAGADVVCIAEQAPLWRMARFAAGLWREPAKVAEAIAFRLRSLPTAFRCGTWVSRVRRVGAEFEVELASRQGRELLRADLVGVGYGLVASTELAELAGCAIEGGCVRVTDRQETSVAGILAAGESTGVAGAAAALVEGRIAGAMAAGAASEGLLPLDARDGGRRFAHRLERDFAPRAELRSLADPDTIVCRCEDVRYGALDPAWSARHAKLLTRAGMGRCQGRVCGPALDTLFGWEPDHRRMPAFPVALSALRQHCEAFTSPTES
jgi:NADPH-dependent 2,4-dienoyl-CoA reductase/sulfur reductase-like enzyme